MNLSGDGKVKGREGSNMMYTVKFAFAAPSKPRAETRNSGGFNHRRHRYGLLQRDS